MSQYFESIRVQHRQLHLLQYHNERIARTQAAMMGQYEAIDLSSLITVPDHVDEGLWKCKVIYDDRIQSITFTPYPGRTLLTFKIIQSPNIDYTYKGDRSELNRLYATKGDHDDIIIVKDGYLTDSYWSNILLHKDGRWFTPDTPLLKGVMRQFLIDEQIIEARSIEEADLYQYDAIMTVNALNPFEPERSVSIHNIY